MRRLLACLLVACGGAPAVPARTMPDPPRHSKLDLAITGMRVSNGLRIVFVPDPRATEVQVTMRYHVGQVDDPPGHEGLARKM